MRKLIYICLLIPMLNACTFNPFGSEGDFDFVADGNWSTKDVTLSCGKNSTKKECDGSVGILLFSKPYFMGGKAISRCTAWFKEPTVIVANMHCADKMFSGKINVATKGTSFVTVDQNNIKHVYNVTHLIQGDRDSLDDTDRSDTEVDYAFFKLEKPAATGTPMLQIDARTPVDGEKIKIVVVNRKAGSSNNLDYQLDTLDCELSGGHLYTQFLYNKNSSRWGGFNCPVQGGNSGAAVQDSSGKVIGLLDSKFNDSEKHHSFFSQLIFWDFKLSTLSWGSNDKYAMGGLFQCIPSIIPSTVNTLQSKNCTTHKKNITLNSEDSISMYLFERFRVDVLEHAPLHASASQPVNPGSSDPSLITENEKLQSEVQLLDNRLKWSQKKLTQNKSHSENIMIEWTPDCIKDQDQLGKINSVKGIYYTAKLEVAHNYRLHINEVEKTFKSYDSSALPVCQE